MYPASGAGLRSPMWLSSAAILAPWSSPCRRIYTAEEDKCSPHPASIREFSARRPPEPLIAGCFFKRNRFIGNDLRCRHANSIRPGQRHAGTKSLIRLGGIERETPGKWPSKWVAGRGLERHSQSVATCPEDPP